MAKNTTRPTKNEVEDMQIRDPQDLCLLVERLGYGGFPHQLMNANGSHVSSLLNFFDDNPGALEAVQTWILENSNLEEESPESCDCRDCRDECDCCYGTEDCRCESCTGS